MSELLLRGWNVAVPVVDIGDDVLIIDDNDKTTFRLQVKSTEVTSESKVASFGLSRRQLRDAAPQIELVYMLLARYQERWVFFVIPRSELNTIHRSYLEADHSGPGRPPKRDNEAKSNTLTFRIDLRTNEGWRTSLHKYRESWPAMLPELSDGPGSRVRAGLSSA